MLNLSEDRRMIEATATTSSDPIRAMLLFHRSIRAALQVFDEVVALAEDGRCDELKASALCDFFTGPMRWHDIDERESLLKRLAHVDAPAFGAALQAALAEHDQIDAIVAGVINHLQRLSQLAALPDPVLLRSAAARLRGLLEAHLEREEREVFPRARKLLSARDLADISREVVARRVRRRAPG